MKIAGIVLICLQVIAVLGGIVSGSLSDMVTEGNFAVLLGFFLPCIIGIILLVKANKKAKK